VWWLLGVAMLAIASYYAISRVYLWSQERRLITQGVRVDAEVMHWEIAGEAPKGKVVQADAGVQLRYAYNRQTYQVFGALAGRKEPIVTRTMVPIYVDRDDPTRWTARLTPASLWQELLPAMLLLPFAIIPCIVAVVTRQTVLRIYRSGEPVLAEVVGIGHSAAAPWSRLVRCAAHVGADARVIKVLLPTRKTPAVGQPLWLLAPPSRPEQAVPAALFE
jgi:hypothetical protein